MTFTDRRARFRALLAGDACLRPGSVFDPLSARIAEAIGYEIGMFAGSTASLTVLGAPDLIVLTLTEFAQQALRINRALAHMPLMVDADHGYGNALNVKRTVEELEIAGVSALTIEDTRLPVPFASAGVDLIPVAEGVGKMRAALAGRSDAALCVLARTSAMQIAGVAETVERARAYAATGVDGLFLVGVTTRGQLDAVAEAAGLPLVLNTMPAELADPAYLAARRVKIALQGHAPIAAAIQAVHTTLQAQRHGKAPEGLAGDELMKRVTRDADYKQWNAEFLH